MRATTFFLLGLLSVHGAEAQVTLASQVIVEGKRVTLGDVFTGVRQADVVVGDAPQPGKSYYLGIKNLRKLANTYGVDWSPQSVSDGVQVSRASQKLRREDVLGVLQAALREKVAQEAITIEMNGDCPPLHLAVDEPLEIHILTLKLNSDQTRYTAKLKAAHHTFRVNGKIAHQVQVPVLNRTIVRGQKIEPEDITWILRPTKQLNPTVLMEAQAIIGATPKSATLRANVPLRKYDIEFPQAVKRGDQVGIRIQTPFMTLTTQGKAKDSGRMGEVIRVVNLDSQALLHGRISGKNQVDITTPVIQRRAL